MISTASAFALLSLVFAAPAVVEAPIGLIATLSDSDNVNGFMVFSKDDGSLWLRNPNDVGAVQMLANMDVEGKVNPGESGNALFVNGAGALILSRDGSTPFVINDNSVLANSEGLSTLSGCPIEGSTGYDVFFGKAVCENRVEFSLRAVTDGSMPLGDYTNNLDVKQNFCCPLKGCFKCGGCRSHGTCKCTTNSGHTAVFYPPPPPISYTPIPCGPTVTVIACPTPSNSECTSCGTGTGPVIIGTHGENSNSAPFTNGTISTSVPTTTSECTTLVSVVTAVPCASCGISGSCGCAAIPAPSPAPVPAPICSTCNAPASSCSCNSGSVFGPGTNYGHCSCSASFSGKPCFCPKGLLHKLPCPKNILCGLCNARPCACASEETSDCKKCNYKRCICPKDILCNFCGGKSGSCGCNVPTAQCDTCGASSGSCGCFGSGSGSFGHGSGYPSYPCNSLHMPAPQTAPIPVPAPAVVTPAPPAPTFVPVPEPAVACSSCGAPASSCGCSFSVGTSCNNCGISPCQCFSKLKGLVPCPGKILCGGCSQCCK